MRIHTVILTPAHWLAIAIAILCVSLQIAGLDSTLRFDRDSISEGQWWLLLSGNFVHLGHSHLLMNMAGLALITALVWPNYSARQWLVITLVASLTVGIGIYVRDPGTYWYVGFSGTLHGLMLSGSLADLRRYPVSASLLTVLVVGKLAWEQLYGPLPGSESTAGGPVMVNAHLYGAIGGLLCAGLFLSWRHLRARYHTRSNVQR